MADNNESVDVNITAPINGDASDSLAPQADSYAAVLRSENEHHPHKHHDHHSNTNLKARLAELERENAEAKEKVKATDAIASHAHKLETDVVRLQHDLGTALNAGEEAGKEIERLNKEIDGLRSEKSALSEELGRKIGELEKARESAVLTVDGLNREIAQVRMGKSIAEKVGQAFEMELKTSKKEIAKMAERIEELAKGTKESAKRGINEVVKEVGFLKKKVSVPVVGVVSAGVVVAAVAVFCVRFSRAR